MPSLGIFQSTRSARSATVVTGRCRRRPAYFNPRAPRGARPKRVRGKKVWSLFQSTRSARSATKGLSGHKVVIVISIHALREERDGFLLSVEGAARISIHALREERDSHDGDAAEAAVLISIHALREERDSSTLPSSVSRLEFQSTRSARSATTVRPASRRASIFQSTRSARSATRACPWIRATLRNFNPRAPRGARPTRSTRWGAACRFQSTRSARSATRGREPPPVVSVGFQSTRSARSATAKKHKTEERSL